MIIGDAIRAWADKNIRNATAMTRNTEAYNHMQEALQELLSQPWATQPIEPPDPLTGQLVDRGGLSAEDDHTT